MKTVTTESMLVTFLYLLMRDDITPGVVAGKLQELTQVQKTWTLTNGHLANYAKEVAKRLGAGGV